MSPTDLITLLPLIEAALKEAPTIVADIEAIIARVKGGTSAPIVTEDATKAMAALDAQLSLYR